jgi:HlyD family secretion protein
MKLRKIAVTIFILCAVLAIIPGCSSKTTSTVKTQVVNVQKGTLSESITGTGNLALSRTEDLAFEVAGYVAEVLVSEGESVKEGQELAKLDTSEWETELKTLKKTLETAQRNLSTKTSALTTAERLVITRESALTKAERLVTTREFAVSQAQLDVQTAAYNLSQIADVKQAQKEVDNAEYALKFARSVLTGELGGGVDLSTTYWTQLAANAQDELVIAKENLKDLLNGAVATTSEEVALQVATKQLAVEKADMALEDAKTAVEDARSAVNDAQLAVDDAKSAVDDAGLDVADAEQSVADARSKLDEAQSKSPIITAPFDSFITSIKVTGGDEVYKGTIAMQIADPNQFAAKILVTEEDIFSVKLGQAATVSLTALSDLTFPATITRISPTATVSSGVVNYSVSVNITSLQPVTAVQTTSSQPAAPSANVTAPSGTASSNSLPGVARTAAATSTTSSVSGNVTLKDGLSATVSIISQQKNNILIIPSKAITRQGGSSTVQVVKGTGTETRTVTTGMTDGTSTEITSGLAEGEQVVIKTTSTSSTSSTTKTTTAASGIQGLTGGPSGPPPGGF